VTKEIELEAYPKEKLKVNFGEMFNKQIPAFKLIEPDIAYLYPGSLKRGEITQIIPEIAKTKGLVIDLRSYPSDFIVFSLGEYLMPKTTSFVKFSNGSVTTPGLFTVSDELKVGKENSDHYKGKVVILINETTQSQAEYTTMALRTAPRATVIGSTTAGADGNVSQFFLPGGISTMISGIGVYYPDGKETQRVGIVPDIVVKPTIKGIRAGRDEPLEKAIEIINAK
jgi:C-terminal processing protease CtpA/Prc